MASVPEVCELKKKIKNSININIFITIVIMNLYSSSMFSDSSLYPRYVDLLGGSSFLPPAFCRLRLLGGGTGSSKNDTKKYIIIRE